MMSSESIVAQTGPYPVGLKAGKSYYWCACGRSKSQPFCDGSHKITSLTPVLHEAKDSRTAYFCGCKRTGTRPLCDGTHKTL
jgi:CDGSH-type Zn-finger protein